MKRKTESILIVSRNKSECESMVSNTNKDRYSFFPADTFQSAMSFIESEPIRIVFIDISDYQDGYLDFIEEIKRKKPGLGIIVITADISDSNLKKAFENGADNIFVKPLNYERLPLIISSSIERQSAVIQIREHMKKLERDLDSAARSVELLTEREEQNFTDTVKSFVGLLETRDLHMGSHCKRVSTFCKAMCEKYTLKSRVKYEIEIGALLHDIGKIGLPDIILRKTRSFFIDSQLTNKERAIYEKHPVIGQEAIEMVGTLSNVSSYIRHHHERFDGSGYPDGLKGFYIPLGSRIIGLVDAYDKIVFGVEKSKQNEAQILFLKYLKKHKGKIFDPEASEKLIEYLKEFKKEEYSKERRITISDVIPGMMLARDVYTRSGVLVISQYEKITGNDTERLRRFLDTNMIIDNIYVYESSAAIGKISPKKKKDRTVFKKEEDKGTVENVYEIIDGVNDFSTLATIHVSFMDYLSDAKSTKIDYANILKRDPVVTLKMIRMANSPLLGNNTVTTVEDAINILGFNEIRNIVSSIPQLQQSDDSTDIFDREAFWQHMTGTGIICKFIGKQIGVKFVEEFYTAGLLHDIGKLAFDQLFPEHLQKMLTLIEEESIFYRKAERSVFGYTHEEVGEYVLNKWNIPEVIKDGVRNHHSPMDSKVDPVLVSAVHLANIISHILHIGESGEKTPGRYENFAEQKLGFSLTDMEALIPEIDEEVKISQEILFKK